MGDFIVISRSKLMIHDDLLRPYPDISLKFSGKNPEKFYKEIPKFLAAIFRVHTGQLQEKRVMLGKGETDKFKFVWELDKDLDKYSYYYVEIEVSGSVSKGVGNADVVIKPALRTEYPQDTFWEKSLLYEFIRMLWHSTFYNSQREEWIRDGRRMVAQLVEDVKALAHRDQE